MGVSFLARYTGREVPAVVAPDAELLDAVKQAPGLEVLQDRLQAVVRSERRRVDRRAQDVVVVRMLVLVPAAP